LEVTNPASPPNPLLLNGYRASAKRAYKTYCIHTQPYRTIKVSDLMSLEHLRWNIQICCAMVGVHKH